MELILHKRKKLFVSYSRSKFLCLESEKTSKEQTGDLFTGAGEHGWHGGESARLQPMCPAWISARCHSCVEFVVGSRFARRVFTPASPPGSPPSLKANSSQPRSQGFPFEIGKSPANEVEHLQIPIRPG